MVPASPDNGSSSSGVTMAPNALPRSMAAIPLEDRWMTSEDRARKALVTATPSGIEQHNSGSDTMIFPETVATSENPSTISGSRNSTQMTAGMQPMSAIRHQLEGSDLRSRVVPEMI